MTADNNAAAAPADRIRTALGHAQAVAQLLGQITSDNSGAAASVGTFLDQRGETPTWIGAVRAVMAIPRKPWKPISRFRRWSKMLSQMGFRNVDFSQLARVHIRFRGSLRSWTAASTYDGKHTPLSTSAFSTLRASRYSSRATRLMNFKALYWPSTSGIRQRGYVASAG
jgi:hypothetical protein